MSIRKFVQASGLACSLAACLCAAAPAPDKLGRDNPQSSVIAFLQACRRQDYGLAAQYLDLRKLPEKERTANGPEVAQKLEAALNSASEFHLLRLSQDPQGDAPASETIPREQVAALTEDGRTYTLDVERVILPPATAPVWVFTPETVTTIQSLQLPTVAPWLRHYLPAFMFSVKFLETPLWGWLAMLIAAMILVSLSRRLDRMLLPVLRTASERFIAGAHWEWTEALLRPLRMLLSLAVFRLVVEVVRPAAVARLYIGRLLEVLLIWSIAWCLVRIVDLFLNRIESQMASQREFSGRSMLRLGRRTGDIPPPRWWPDWASAASLWHWPLSRPSPMSSAGSR